MNKRVVFHLVSYMTFVIGIAIIGCAGVSYYYDEPLAVQMSLVYSGLIAISCAGVAGILTRCDINLSRRDGFGIVTFGWISATIFGSLPYILSGVIPHPVSAMFETMSGFTTTGASVLNDLESIPRGIHFWRALTHWFGGMGVLVLCVAILPFLGVGGMQIYRAEMPGPSKDRLTPRIATTAKLLWGVYALLTMIEVLCLKFAGMGWFDSFCHAFGTMATGGFSTRSASVGAFDSAMIDTILIVFMFLAGVNFSLHYYALTGKPGRYFRDPEFRFYFIFLVCATLFITFNVWLTDGGALSRCFRDSAFTATSIMTTTGFCTADFDQWPNASRLLLVVMMFIGGCAGSTGGGMKVVRVFIMFKKMVREMKLFMRPSAVIQMKLGGKPVEQEVISHIAAFFAIFILIFAIGSFIMTFFTPDLETACSCVIATLGNIGPGLNAVGATQNYSCISPSGQGILIVFMLLGRLELYTVLILFLPGFWKR
ncbi:TrkH family potassium uptake protein [Pontiella sulfatireligans]|uniref:Trk system potassium uptake protein TrkH n=1 Tax=Pontiella sulfatireligans TaxID=2750658 RepID=A0A6C2URX1_9BACT|nr:TrkH family potassium uptake protein [Pontiella sulfatireligans]VGO23082.1 Trk system potassium uptake protein TrkH [Pontiella sulfatireligans]